MTGQTQNPLGGRHLPPPFPAAAPDGPDPAADAFLASVLAIAGHGAGHIHALLRAAGLLDRQGRMRARNPETSRLNANGAPVQLCLTTPQHQPSVTDTRLLLDPFFDLPATQRIRASLELADALATRMGTPLPLDQLAPMATLPGVGAIWLALPLTHGGTPLPDPASAGIAAYFNPEVFGETPWPDTRARLDRLLPNPARRQHLLDIAQSVSTPICLAIEAAKNHATRVKLYLRATGDPAPVLAHLPADQRPNGPPDLLNPQSSWPASGVTLALGFAPDTGAPDGAKVDLCLCPDCRAAAQVPQGLRQRLQQALPYSALPDHAGLALLGFAGGGKGARMNAYFAPHSNTQAGTC